MVVYIYTHYTVYICFGQFVHKCPDGGLTNGEWHVWALQCHVTGDNLHTCALICSAVGGLILSHYCRRCQHTRIAHTAARVSVLPLDHASRLFSSVLHPERTIRKQNCCREHLRNIQDLLVVE